ncbi:mechanosensitive ion channel-like protein [Permianibacter aggregans]|uniref:Mechanosensitive ion channel-like protein n=2 Tax=Permianibacter aggregans TaxID=1510150 RepID=A0A4R6URV4_9GAMM|nr:mechanosensitive ion channel-like protein [Permianibacter aggregans]
MRRIIRWEAQMQADGISWQQIIDWLTTPLFTIGKSSLSIASIVGLVVLVVLFWWGAQVIESTLRKFASKTPRLSESTGSVYAWARILRYIIWIAGTFAALSYIGIDLTGLAIVGGAIGVGVGLGLQSIVANFVSGIILLLEKSLKVGDFVELESGVRGHVREISLRFTRITTNDDVDILVPNNEFTQARLVNWTYSGHKQRLHIPFGVAYGSDKDKVKAAGLRAAKRVQGVLDEPGRDADVWLVEFGDSSLNFELVLWVGPDLVARPGRTKAMLLWAIEDELGKEGLEIPFPQRDLHVRSGSLEVSLKQNESPKPNEAPETK